MSVDTMVEGIHFLPNGDPEALGWKLAAVNLSDLASKGARPEGYLLSIATGPAQNDDWLDAFSRGLERVQNRFGWSLWGGDSVRTTGPVTLSLTAFGTVDRPIPLRSGAQIGDDVWVSGTLGDAALGLRIAKGTLRPKSTDDAEFLQQCYDAPKPRIALGQALAPLVGSAMDVSDGVFGDAGHIAKASGVRLTLWASKIPTSEAAERLLSRAPELVEFHRSGGDDYEILCTAKPERRDAIRSAARESGVSVTRIGEVDRGEGVRLLSKNGEEIALPKGWTHF